MISLTLPIERHTIGRFVIYLEFPTSKFLPHVLVPVLCNFTVEPSTNKEIIYTVVFICYIRYFF